MMPKSQLDANFTSENSPELCRICRFCMSSITNCLPSPAVWKGTSSARFGLDIGGTLCKFVYFEPFTANLLDTPSYGSETGASFLATPSHGSTIGASESSPKVASGNYFISTQENTNVRVEEQNNENTKFENKNRSLQNEGKLSMSEKNDFLSDTNACGLEMDDDKKWAQGPVKRHTFCNAVDVLNVPFGMGMCLCKTSLSTSSSDGICSESERINAKLDKLMSEGSSREQRYPESEDSSIQIRKSWMPSHHVVNLPGCGTLFLECFETWRMDEFLFLIKEHSLRALGATGGGAQKFGSSFLEIAGLQFQFADELQSLVRGIDFLVKHAQFECFEYPVGGVIQHPLNPAGDSSNFRDSDFSEDRNSFRSKLTEPGGILEDKDEKTVKGAKVLGSLFENECTWCPCDSRSLYPYLVVNIGSGVGILRVDSPDQFQRLGGTSIGGSTFLGLSAALTGCNSFDEAIKLASEGDSTEIDMLVGDIYGEDYTEMGLAVTTIASSFGKLVEPSKKAEATQTPEHLAKAALLMVTNNIGSLAMLHARATAVDHVMFTGSFLHGNKLAMWLLTVTLEFRSKGQIKAIFLRHGHAGAIGALLTALDPSDEVDALLLK